MVVSVASFARLALVLSVATLSAGCTGPTREADAGPADPILVTDPRDYSYLANGTAGAGHLHDYWGGGDRLVVLDQEAAVDGTGALSGTAETFRPEPGAVVPLGTASVEVSVRWTPGPTDQFGAVELFVETAADQDFRSLGLVESGSQVVLATTNEQNDLPHQVLSGWSFRVYFHATDGEVVNLQSMPVRVRAEAVRGLDIPVFPAHPDHWQGRSEVTILQASGQTVATLQAAEANVQGALRAHEPDDGQMVLPGTREVVVTLSNDGPTPLALGLSFHGADTYEHAPVQASVSAGSSWEFHIPVGPGQADGPYAQKSLWSFRVEVQEPVAGGPFSGSYSLSATIIRG